MALSEMIFTDTPPYSRARLNAALGKAVLGAAVAIGVLGAGEAQALVVNVNGQNWNVTFFDGVQNDSNASKFATPANGGAMPWYTGDAASCGTRDYPSLNTCLATKFASAVGTQLNSGSPGGAPIRFAFSPVTSGAGVGPGVPGPAVGPSAPATRTGQFISYYANGDLFLDTEPVGNNARWAYVDPAYPLPVPGPLPALGAAAAFGFSRKLRQRIKVNKSVGASITAG